MSSKTSGAQKGSATPKMPTTGVAAQADSSKASMSAIGGDAKGSSGVDNAKASIGKVLSRNKMLERMTETGAKKAQVRIGGERSLKGLALSLNHPSGSYESLVWSIIHLSGSSHSPGFFICYCTD